MDANDLARHQCRCHSQQGEDGIIDEIFKRGGHAGGFFVEVGTGNGSECNSAHLSRCRGWSGLMIEGNAQEFAGLLDNFRSVPEVRVANHFVRRDNIVQIFSASNIPRELDLLSIDIDGNDYWIWEQLESYRPRVVVIEYNASLPPESRLVMEYNPNHVWQGSSYFGASLGALAALGERLGYALVATEDNGVNAFFVREDLMSNARLKSQTAKAAYHPPRYGAFREGHPPGEGPYVTV
jgi:hypothetical protein